MDNNLPVQFSSISLKYEERYFQILDQNLLPEQEIWLDIKGPEQMLVAIKNLSVRGAPLLAVAAALSFYDWLLDHDEQSLLEKKKIIKLLKHSRPTAVNLSLVMEEIERTDLSLPKVKLCIKNIIKKELDFCSAIVEQEKHVIASGDNILTYCNTGELATLGLGTALGLIKKAFLSNKNIHVYASETRPLNQGARLTVWELAQYKIPNTLICDNTVAYLMGKKKIDKVFVGADRVALNGDTANKIGTYSLAILAQHHNIPFYVVAPENTFDLACVGGENIPIEQRSGVEVSSFWNKQKGINILNYAFDVTPVKLITGIITNNKIIKFNN